MSTGKQQSPKPDRRTIAYLDAAVLAVAGAKGKLPAHELIGQLSRDGIHVTFDQVEKSVRRLGLKWRDAFLPATRVERGYPPSQAKADKWSVFEELDKTTDAHWSTADPDMQDVLGKIERLEETLATSGMAEYRALCDRIRSLDERATVIHTDVKRAVVESRNLHQQAKQEAQLAKDRAAAMRADMKTVLEQLDRISRRQDILYNIVGSVKLEHDRQKAAAARSLLQDVEDASSQEDQQ